MSDLVSYEKAGPVAFIRFDDGKVNVMSSAMLGALDAAFSRAESDRALVVLKGRRGIFSAGFDLKVFASGSAEEIYDMMSRGAALAARLLSYPAPIVACCTGHAFPMGAFLLLASDVRIGVLGSYRIGFNEVTINIPLPSFGVELARARLTPAYFQRVPLTGEMLAPEEAVTAGFLDRVVPETELDAAVEETARRLASVDRASHATTKERVRGPAVKAVRAAIEAEITIDAYRRTAPRRIVLPGSAPAPAA